MKKRINLLLFVLLSFTVGLCQAAAKETRDEIYQEIRSTIGIVPEFFDFVPEDALRNRWDTFVIAFLTPGEGLSSREKELVGVGVAGIHQCPYCVELHRRLAEFHGATEAEINDAVQVPYAIGAFSSFLHAIDYPLAQFSRDVDQILCFLGDSYCTLPAGGPGGR